MRFPSWRWFGLVGVLCVSGAVKALPPDPAAEMRRRLDAIVMPHIELRATTLGDAVEYLRQESRRLDPAQRGANILIAPTAARTPMTMTLSRIPLLTALRYLAAQAGLKIRIEPYAVSMVPVSDPSGDLVTAEFRVAPSFFNQAPAK